MIENKFNKVDIVAYVQVTEPFRPPRILDKCVFPHPFVPKTFNHFPGQFGQLSINLYAEKLLLET